MHEIQFDHVTKQYASGPVALCEVSLQILPGELLTVVGPSGSGKSTLLRLIAGLEMPSTGMIRFDGADVTGCEPAQRQIGMVFQSHNLLEHLDVRDNLTFSLRMRRQPSAAIQQKLDEVVTRLHLEPLLNRWPAELSGGEQQRVAIGRALTANAEILLLDEPLAQLDALRQAELSATIRELHRSAQVTMVYVTHDQGEAMALGDRLAVLSHGRIEQVATPRDAYQFPATRFVAEFLGVPRMNVLEAQVDEYHMTLCGHRHRLPSIVASRLSGPTICVGVRAERLHIAAEQHSDADQFDPTITGHIAYIEFRGHESVAYVQVEGQPQWVACRISAESPIAAGDAVRMSYRVEDLHVLLPDGSIARINR